jgi:ATP:ADP antiporter, AAA family
MLNGLLHLKDDELPRLLPFFLLYSLLFAALSLADGLSLALFVEEVGAKHLPAVYAMVAVLNAAFVGWYFLRAFDRPSDHVFKVIVGGCFSLFLLSWVSARYFGSTTFAYSLLYVSREIGTTMVLLHFGTYLQEYFTREQMNRVLPITYAGGRVGGIIGAGMLENLSEPWGLVNMMLVVCGYFLVSLAGIEIASRRMPKAADEDTNGPAGAAPTPEETAARTTVRGFLRYLFHSRLLFWISATSLLYFMLRWVLNYQYNTFFEDYFHDLEFQAMFFDDDVEADSDVMNLAQFLGRYTQIALAVSLFLQLFVVNRLIAWFGAKATHLVYSLLLFAALAMQPLEMTLALAVYCRFVETELRLGLRNPVMMLITNDFTKPVRARVRAWTTGLLIPAATLAASAMLAVFVKYDWSVALNWTGIGMGAVYLFCVFKMGSHFRGAAGNAKA